MQSLALAPRLRKTAAQPLLAPSATNLLRNGVASSQVERVRRVPTPGRAGSDRLSRHMLVLVFREVGFHLGRNGVAARTGAREVEKWRPAPSSFRLAVPSQHLLRILLLPITAAKQALTRSRPSILPSLLAPSPVRGCRTRSSTPSSIGRNTKERVERSHVDLKGVGRCFLRPSALALVLGGGRPRLGIVRLEMGGEWGRGGRVRSRRVGE